MVATRPAPPAQDLVPPLTLAPRSKAAAATLAFTLGWLGIHNFYLGRNGLGLTQLWVTIGSCGLMAPVVWTWAFVEGVLILTGGIKDKLGRPLV